MMMNITKIKSSVIICGGAAKPALKEIKHYTNKDNTYFVGVDAGSLQLIQAGYELDYAVGDFDSVTDAEFKQIEAHTKVIIKHPAQKDDTDMELALEIVRKEFPDSHYYIFGAIGEKKGRLDHMLANIWMVYQPRFVACVGRMTFIENNHVFHFYNPGAYTIEPTESLPDYISIISMTAIKNLTIKNAVYNLESTDFAYPRALISNEFIDYEHPIKISFDEGLILVLRVNERN